MKIKMNLDWKTPLWRDFTALGGAVFFILVALVTLLLQENKLFWQLVFGFVITLLVTVMMRKVYFRDRPKKQEYSNFLERIDASSFPSLHTARAVFLGLMFVYFLKNNFLSVLIVLIALCTIYSRIYLKKHDWWDLLGGTALGIIAFALNYWIF